MRSVRFVHAADLHLSAPFKGVDASDERVSTALVASTFEALERIVDLCVFEGVDFLLISGDVRNSRDKSRSAELRFQVAMVRLAAAGIPVFVASGNHDPADGWSAGLALPETVRYFSTAAVEALPFEREGERLCTLYGRGYGRAAETRDLASGFRRSADDAIAIGVLHANVGGRTDFENYAPASMGTLRAARMDYWALGHIHKPEVLSETPAIVYAGSPQGLNPKEDGLHGCYLVELGHSGASIDFRPVCSVVWSRVAVDVSECAGIEQVRDVLRATCDRLRGQADGRPAIARIELTGRCEAHEELVAGTATAELLADLRDEQMGSSPWVWIDRISDRTTASLDIERLRDSQDFRGDLVRLADEIAADPALVASLIADIKGPMESSVGSFETDLSSAELLMRARDVCLDLLEGEVR